MVTDLQLARRLEPETGQYTQTEIGEGPRAGPTQAAAAPLRSRVGSSSDDEDAGEGPLPFGITSGTATVDTTWPASCCYRKSQVQRQVGVRSIRACRPESKGQESEQAA